MKVMWADGYCRYPQLPLRRLFSPLQRSVKEGADIVTAYNDGTVTLRSNRRLEGYHEAADLSGFQGVEPGDFVVHGLDILHGSVGVSDSSGAISSVCTVCAPRVQLDPRFFAYAIRAESFSGLPRALARGVREGGADFRRWDTLAELPLPVPPLASQRAIADYLDGETSRIDTLIAKKRRIFELLQERSDAQVVSLVTTGMPAPTCSPDHPGEASEWLGETPIGWRVIPLKRIARCESSGIWGAEPGNLEADLPVATTAQLASDGTFNVPEMPIRSFSPSDARFGVCRPGQILVVKSSGSAKTIVSGKAGLVDESTPTFVFSNFLMRLTPDRSLVRPDFLYAFVTSTIMRERIKRMVSATTYPNLRVDEYMSSLTPLPPRNVQAQIAEQLTTNLLRLRESKRLLLKSVDLIATRRRTLITAAVTGQLDIPGAAA